MRKLIFALLMVAIAMPAFASETRLRTLGPQVAPFIEDDANVFKWYGTLPSYANLVTITAGYDYVIHQGYDQGWYESWSDEALYAKFGFTYGLGEDHKFGVIGLWWEENTSGPLWGHEGLWFGPYSGSGWDGWNFSRQLDNKWNAMWGYALDGVSFGVYFSRADVGMNGEGSESYADDDYFYNINYEYEDHKAYTTLGVGARFDIGDKMYADLAADYTTCSYTWEETVSWTANIPEVPSDTSYTEGIWNDKSSTMSFRGRMFYEWSDVITLVPYFSFLTGEFSLKPDSTDWYDLNDDNDVWGLKGMHLDFGIGANLRVNDETLLIIAVKPYMLATAEPAGSGGMYGYKYRQTVFPGFAFGFETDVKSWLTFRAGCDKMFVKDVYEATYEDTEAEDYTYSGEYEWSETSAPFNWHLGLGFHVGNFDIDMMVNKQVPFSLGYWLTGFSPDDGDYSGTPVGMISATYHF